METKTKAFDAVAESRKWREAASRKLNAMSREERLAYLNALGKRVRGGLRPGLVEQERVSR
jgi:hypothetical protein